MIEEVVYTAPSFVVELSLNGLISLSHVYQLQLYSSVFNLNGNNLPSVVYGDATTMTIAQNTVSGGIFCGTFVFYVANAQQFSIYQNTVRDCKLLFLY